MVSKRSRILDSSGIRKVFDLAAKMERPVDLSIGQPHFDVSEPIKRSACDAINDGKNAYTVTQGIPELLERLRVDARSRGYDPEGVLVTSGVTGGIVLALLALCDPGDEILVSDPYFVMYKHLARLFGVTPVFFDTYPDFHMRREAMEPLITDRTRLIVVNSPGNPTGVSATAEELEMVADLARKNDLPVLSDGIYRCFRYDHDYIAMADYYDRVLVLDGFSKSHGMTGWRTGYATGPADIIDEMTKIQQYTFVCAPSMAQWAAVDALDQPMDTEIDAYRRKRDIVYDGLKDKFNVQCPDGAFYIFPEAPGGSGTDFVMKAVENNVLVIPGNVFSERDTHFRISFAAPDEVLREGVEILNGLA